MRRSTSLAAGMAAAFLAGLAFSRGVDQSAVHAQEPADIGGLTMERAGMGRVVFPPAEPGRSYAVLVTSGPDVPDDIRFHYDGLDLDLRRHTAVVLDFHPVMFCRYNRCKPCDEAEDDGACTVPPVPIASPSPAPVPPPGYGSQMHFVLGPTP